MRIAIDASGLGTSWPTGLYFYTRSLIEALARIDTVNSYRLLFTGLRLRKEDIPLAVGDNFTRTVLRVREKRSPLGAFLRDRMLLPALLGLGSTDVFHLPAGPSLPRTGGARAVITIHDLRGLYRIPGDLPQDVEALGRSARAAHRVIVVSQATRRDLVERLGIPEDKVRVVHSAPGQGMERVRDEARLEAVRQTHRLTQPYFLSLGAGPRKNIERLLQAFHRFRYKNEFLLVLGGGLAESRRAAAYRTLIEELGLGEQVRLPAWCAPGELSALLSGAIAFVFPSLCEGFGFPVLEAMACEAPVITSNTTSMPEVAGDAALFVDPHDVESIRAAMERLVEDEELREVLRRKGRCNLERFSWEKTARGVLEVYEELGGSLG